MNDSSLQWWDHKRPRCQFWQFRSCSWSISVFCCLFVCLYKQLTFLQDEIQLQTNQKYFCHVRAESGTKLHFRTIFPRMHCRIQTWPHSVTFTLTRLLIILTWNHWHSFLYGINILWTLIARYSFGAPMFVFCLGIHVYWSPGSHLLLTTVHDS